MKLLMFYAPSFWFRTFEKVLEGAPEQDREETLEEAVVVFYQVEENDEPRRGKVITKAIKNIKWLAGKFGAGTVVLHLVQPPFRQQGGTGCCRSVSRGGPRPTATQRLPGGEHPVRVPERVEDPRSRGVPGQGVQRSLTSC